MGRALIYVVPIALAVYALIDLSRSLPEERSGVPTAGWVAIIVLLPVLGPIAWVVLSRNARSAGGGGGGGTPGTGRPGGPRPPAPRAPDDDPDFLWRLEQERRRAQRGPAAEPNPPAEDDDGTPSAR